MRDVALYPGDAGLTDFGWRLSIAEVAEGKPFSIFPGVDRHLAILVGRMALAVGDAPEGAPLTIADNPVQFPGDVATTGRPIGVTVTDLNLMIRRDAFYGRLTVADAFDQATVCETTVLVARFAMTVTVEDQEIMMAPLDALLLPRGTRVRANAPLLLAQIDPICDVRKI